MKIVPPIAIILPCLALASCALVTTPLKIAGKVTTGTIGLAGKAAGAGIDAFKRDKEEEKKKPQPAEQPQYVNQIGSPAPGYPPLPAQTQDYNSPAQSPYAPLPQSRPPAPQE